MTAKAQNIIGILLLIVGIVVIGVSIGGIANAQLVFAVHCFIVILVLTVFAIALGVILKCMKRASGKSSEYDVNDVENGGGRSGRRSTGVANGAAANDNKAYVGDDGGGGGSAKWVSNYVPYGDYPAGAIQQKQQTQQQNGDSAAWKSNYVPYSEDGKPNGDENK